MKTNLKVHGMHCSSCEMILKDSISELSGVSNVKVSAAKGEVNIDFDDSKISLEEVKKKIKNEGYKVV